MRFEMFTFIDRRSNFLTVIDLFNIDINFDNLNIK